MVLALVVLLSAQDPKAFIDRANAELKAAWSARERAGFVSLTYITDDTEALAAAASEKAMEVSARLLKEAAQFKGKKLPPEIERQLLLLRLSDAFPAPDDAQARAELAQLSSELTALYGKGEVCDLSGKKECHKLDAVSAEMAKSRDEKRLRELWTGWHNVGASMRPKYVREVELANKGAKSLGFSDLSQLWKSNYDMAPDAFEAETDRLWGQVKPLYEQLHCYVRAKLHETYKTPASGPIPAHLLGNMWAQEWGNVYNLVEPYKGAASLDVTRALVAKKWDAKRIVKAGEGFFTSLGFAPLPETFWTRSMFTRPRDRDVVCHASAWDVSYDNDLRIKMCIQPTEEDFVTVHHELGHDFYYQSYYKLPVLFQAGANDGFHEAVGDAIALSVTPAYLDKIGLIAMAAENDQAVINQMMRAALEKIAFLPFGLVLDRWRWEVFSGRTPTEKMNARYWELRKAYQGVEPPVARSEADFDAGAKYHVPANTPYTRYFLARILQFQFHRAMCQAAGHKGPLHTCSVAGNAAAGEKLRAMLALGASKPWPEALSVLTGSKQMDASALVEYFQPLMSWLEKQNQGQTCGY
jgi:peptidyl-dipeptidase A